MRTLEELNLYILDRISALIADAEVEHSSPREYQLRARIVELQWLQEYLKG